MDARLQHRLAANGGVVTTAQAHACGEDRSTLQRLVRSGRLVRIGYGCYADGLRWRGADARDRHLLRAAAVVLRHGPEQVAASHQTALLAARLPVHDVSLDRVHLSMRRPGLLNTGPSVAVHVQLPADAFVSTGGGRLARVTDQVAVAQTAATSGLAAALVAADAGLHRGLFTRADLARAVNLARLRRGRRRTQELLDLVDPASESPGETLTRLLLRSLDLPAPESQVAIRLPDGRLARVDFLVREHRTIIEFDGAVKYEGAEGRDALVREKKREDQLRALGYQVVRLTWSDLDHPHTVHQRIVAAFARGAA